MHSCLLLLIWILLHHNAQPVLIFSRVRIFHLERLEKVTWFHSFVKTKTIWIARIQILILAMVAFLAQLALAWFNARDWPQLAFLPPPSRSAKRYDTFIFDSTDFDNSTTWNSRIIFCPFCLLIEYKCTEWGKFLTGKRKYLFMHLCLLCILWNRMKIELIFREVAGLLNRNW